MQQAGHTAAIASQPAIGTRVPIGEPPDSLTMLRDVRELLGDPKLDWHDAMKRLRTIQQQ
jgi:hypothetical protein